MSEKLLCDVYKTHKKDELYLYVAQKDGLSRLPDELRDLFPSPVKALTIILTPDKKLGRAVAQDVLDSIDEKGFYLQMPPHREVNKLDVFCKRDDV